MRLQSHTSSDRRWWQWDKDKILIFWNTSIAKKNKNIKEKNNFIFEIILLTSDQHLYIYIYI